MYSSTRVPWCKIVVHTYIHLDKDVERQRGRQSYCVKVIVWIIWGTTSQSFVTKIQERQRLFRACSWREKDHHIRTRSHRGNAPYEGIYISYKLTVDGFGFTERHHPSGRSMSVDHHKTLHRYFELPSKWRSRCASLHRNYKTRLALAGCPSIHSSAACRALLVMTTSNHRWIYRCQSTVASGILGPIQLRCLSHPSSYGTSSQFNCRE